MIFTNEVEILNIVAVIIKEESTNQLDMKAITKDQNLKVGAEEAIPIKEVKNKVKVPIFQTRKSHQDLLTTQIALMVETTEPKMRDIIITRSKTILATTKSIATWVMEHLEGRSSVKILKTKPTMLSKS